MPHNNLIPVILSKKQAKLSGGGRERGREGERKEEGDREGDGKVPAGVRCIIGRRFKSCLGLQISFFELTLSAPNVSVKNQS